MSGEKDSILVGEIWRVGSRGWIGRSRVHIDGRVRSYACVVIERKGAVLVQEFRDGNRIILEWREPKLELVCLSQAGTKRKALCGSKSGRGVKIGPGG